MKDVPSLKEAYTDKLLKEALNIGKERSIFIPKANNKYFGRDIPTIANGLALLHNMFEQPDFEEAEAIERGARNIQRGNVTHIGDYLDLPDVDTNAITNTLLASSAANLKANQNLGLNASQVAGLNLASNYKANRAVGDALLQGKLTQGDINLKEITHNSGVNRFNAEMDYRGLGLNQRADEIAYQGIVSGAQLRAAEKEMKDKSITQPLDNFIGGIGDRATENYWKNIINSLPYNYKLGNDGTVTFGKNGGCLTRRRRRR
jgi:dihydroorotase-like cyclic amidohydrolase